MHKISVIAKPSDNDGLDSLGVQQILITRAAGAQVGAIVGSISCCSYRLCMAIEGPMGIRGEGERI